MGNIPGNEDGEFPAFPAVPVRRKERGTKSTKILLKKLPIPVAGEGKSTENPLCFFGKYDIMILICAINQWSIRRKRI